MVTNHRSQLSIFFIVGLIIFGVVLVSNQINKPIIEQPADSLEINSFIENCLETIGNDAIYSVMFQGGYHHAPESSIPLLNAKIPIYWDKDKNVMPALTKIENELSLYVSDNIGLCLNNFKELEEQGYSIEAENTPDIIARINSADVTFQYNTPIILRKGHNEIKTPDTQTSIAIDLITPYRFAEKIIEEQSREPGYLPLGLITSLAQENNFTFEILHMENSIILSLIFEQKEEELVYAFGIGYESEN